MIFLRQKIFFRGKVKNRALILMGEFWVSLG